MLILLVLTEHSVHTRKYSGTSVTRTIKGRENLLELARILSYRERFLWANKVKGNENWFELTRCWT